ncbi:MAG TPA: hypothetical protein VFZ17_08980, partial [Acidimicrobiia bacterium]|nr:hypothetical protein [Acidimicrobiia bacterium]
MKQEVDTRARLVVIGIVVVALFGGLLTRLWFLQVTGGEKLAVAAQKQRQDTVSVPALRGAILDAKGRVLAQTVLVKSLMVDRQSVPLDEKPKLVASLATFLGVPPEEVEKRLDSQQYAPFEKVPVATELTDDQQIYLAEHATEFPNTSVASTPVRKYSYGTTAAHVLGYLGKINADELKARPKSGYQLDDVIGKAGIELTYEDVLRGTPGIDTVQVDNRGQVTSETTTKAPKAGDDVQLSIDLDAEAIAAESLQQGIDGASSLVSPDTGNYYHPKGGAVVVLDARTGQVVA